MLCRLEALAQTGRGRMIRVGVRARGLVTADGLDQLYPVGQQRWDLRRKPDQRACTALQDELDPVVTHFAPPCTAFCSIGSRPAEGSVAYTEAASMVEYSVESLRRRVERGADGSLDNPKGSRVWGLQVVKDFFGTVKQPRVDRYFAPMDLCQYGLVDPGEPEKYWRKAVVFAATFAEVVELKRECATKREPERHTHQAIRGTVKLASGKWANRAKLSGAYPLALGHAMGACVGAVCARVPPRSDENGKRVSLTEDCQR